MAATLIFPSSVPAARDYARAAAERGEEVVAASSLDYDETATGFPAWVRLPTIHEADFAERFGALVAARGIARVFSPVASVHAFLARLIAERGLDLRLVNRAPIVEQTERYRALLARAAAGEAFVAAAAAGRSVLTRREIAAILRQAETIYGESSESKLLGLMAAFATVPKGDVVEVGSLMGKSAFVLAYLARRYRVGAVLTVDPWRGDDALQHETTPTMQALVGDWDYDVLAEAFFVNMLPVAGPGFGHLRMTSAKAHAHYARGRGARTPEFGAVAYAGRIALLHIDANHDYDSVHQDCALWLPHLAPGGWLVLDDYAWMHGEGPRRVGDRLLAERAAEARQAFVCGRALFLRLG